MPSRMSSLKKRMTLATLLNMNKFPMCCSSVTEKERKGERERLREEKALQTVDPRSEGGRISL